LACELGCKEGKGAEEKEGEYVEGIRRADKECMGTNILASASATSGSKLLRYIVPDHADGLVGPDHGEEKLHDIFRSPGHDCYLGLLGFLDAGSGSCYALLS